MNNTCGNYLRMDIYSPEDVKDVAHALNFNLPTCVDLF